MRHRLSRCPPTVLLSALIFIFCSQSNGADAQDLRPCPDNLAISGWNNCVGTVTDRFERYVGEWRKGKRDGHGTLTFSNGEKYVGEFRNNERDGQGEYTLLNGMKYIGEWHHNERDGWGTLTFANGEKYVGQWWQGLFHGQGTLYSSNGSVIKEGRWDNNKFMGSYNSQNQIASSQEKASNDPTQPNAARPLGRRVALIIGNKNYKYASGLENSANDAKILATTLQSVGFQSVTLKIDLNLEQMLQALRDFAIVADDADWAVVYYAGHGVEFGGANFMIPVDAHLKADRDIDLETVSVSQVLNAIEGAKRLRLVILDACRDNPFASQMRRTMASRSLGRGLARLEPEAGTLVVFAAKHGEIALDGSGMNSPFVEALVKRIQQKPPHEVRRMFDLVRDDVVTATKRLQQPFSYGSLSGNEDFYFIR